MPYRKLPSLSTCNRTELYCAAEPQVAEQLPAWLAEYNQIEAGLLKPHVYLSMVATTRCDTLSGVASGLDSMVPAKPRSALGDVRSVADQVWALALFCISFFQWSFSVAKEAARRPRDWRAARFSCRCK